jgi:hypothetical protein
MFTTNSMIFLIKFIIVVVMATKIDLMKRNYNLLLFSSFLLASMWTRSNCLFLNFFHISFLLLLLLSIRLFLEIFLPFLFWLDSIATAMLLIFKETQFHLLNDRISLRSLIRLHFNSYMVFY